MPRVSAHVAGREDICKGDVYSKDIEAAAETQCGPSGSRRADVEALQEVMRQQAGVGAGGKRKGKPGRRWRVYLASKSSGQKAERYEP
ncbi:hypothetical protein DPEC_G00132490 [Dallia pectoralis]|uniref:Uncharacterized protein n=1 Tax=Dallia pectoralis TaxID=75939 RepID=A0ACC2GRV0_DALPE|nr:hypothetical protein DPEC_G00132490 [Dallia pectoralis]